MDPSTSWIVAAGCCWVYVFAYGIFRSAAIIYTALLNSLNITREEASWPVTLMGIFLCVSGPIVGTLGRRYAIWKLTVPACLVGGLAVSVCFFANGIWFLIVFLGVIYGITISFITLSTTVIRQHFTRYRAVACGICYAGLTIGGLIFPPLLQYLVDEYNTRGMLLIAGALMLNATAGTLLQRLPPDTTRGPPSLQNKDSAHISLDQNKANQATLLECASGKGAHVNLIITKKLHKPKVALEESSALKLPLEEKTYSDVSGIQECVKGAKIVMTSSEECLSTVKRYQHAKKEHQGDGDPKYTRASYLGLKNDESPFTQADYRSKKFKSLFSEGDDIDDAYYETQEHGVRPKNTKCLFKVNIPSYLISPKFYLIASTNGVSLFIMSTYLAVIVDFATDRNISKWDAVLLLMFFSMGDMVAKLGSGWITDKGFIGKNFMTAVNLLVCAVSLCLMPLCHSFYLHAFLAMVVGWCNGATLILIPVLYMDLVDADSFSECFGTSIFLGGVMLLPRPLLVGYFRDDLGDYQGLFLLTGAVTALVAFAWIFDRRTSEVTAPSTDVPLPIAQPSASNRFPSQQSVVNQPGGINGS
uniref:Putative sugar transporter n=1 Tax=Ixodes scapularis TaxID=6945 RepID=A0A4D5S410_IXOSC